MGDEPAAVASPSGEDSGNSSQRSETLDRVLAIATGIGVIGTLVLSIKAISDFREGILIWFTNLLFATALVTTQVIKWMRDHKFGRRQVVYLAGGGLIFLGIILADRLRDDAVRDRLRRDAQGPELIEIAGGTVDVADDQIGQGSTSELTVAAFRIEPYEVTNERYGACVEAGACTPPRDGGRSVEANTGSWPVTGISPHEAYDFCTWIDRELLSEAQYLAATRGTDAIARPYPWGDAPLDESRAHLAFVAADEIPPPFEPTDSDPPIDLSEGGEFGTTEPPFPLGQPLAVDELPLGRTPGEPGVAHLVGNVYELTSTSPELCPVRTACSAAWTPASTNAELLIIRGHAYTTPVVDGVVQGRDAEPIALDPPLRQPDIGFRCATAA